MASAHKNSSISNAFLLLFVPDCKAGGHFQNAIASRLAAQGFWECFATLMTLFNNAFSIAIGLPRRKLLKLLIWSASGTAIEKLVRSMSSDWGQSRPFLISKQMNSQCVLANILLACKAHTVWLPWLLADYGICWTGSYMVIQWLQLQLVFLLLACKTMWETIYGGCNSTL